MRLDDAIAFFTELGLVLEGRMPIEGEWAGRVTGLHGQRVEIAMLRTPDGHGRLGRLGATVVDDVVDYAGTCRLCYIRGPEGILTGLAQEIGQQAASCAVDRLEGSRHEARLRPRRPCGRRSSTASSTASTSRPSARASCGSACRAVSRTCGGGASYTSGGGGTSMWNGSRKCGWKAPDDVSTLLDGGLR